MLDICWDTVPRFESFKARPGPSGIHLFNRATGLNILLDEEHVPALRWAAAPRQVSVALTNACDLFCRHCYAPKYPARLDFNHLCNWLLELDANGCLGVGFGGGEPTLYPRFVDVCQFAAQKTGLAVTFTTHAHHIDEALRDALIGNVHFLRVSMDGVGETYESIRGRPFAAFCGHLKTVRALAPFGINYVVNSRTFGDLDAAVELASEVGAVEFLLLPEQPTYRTSGVDVRTIEELSVWVRQYQGPVPLVVSEAGAEGLPTSNPLPHEVGLRAYAHIDASGSLKRSSYESGGVGITDGVMQALELLRSSQKEEIL